MKFTVIKAGVEGSNHIMRYILGIIFIFSSYGIFSQTLSGKVQDSQSGEPIPFVNIYLEDNTQGTYTDTLGYFELNVGNSKHKIHFSNLSYEKYTLEIKLEADSVVQISLDPSDIMMGAVLVEASRTKIGNQIIRKLIDHEENILTDKSTFSSDNYIKTKMEKWREASEPEDSIQIEAGYETVYLSEVASRLHYDAGKFKGEVKGELINSSENDLRRRTRMDIGGGFRGSGQWAEYNPIEFFRNAQDANVELYDNNINCPALSDRPITSPISNGAFYNYRFRLKKIDLRGQDSIFTVSIEPIFPKEPLFSGTVIVNGSNWTIEYASLKLDNNVVRGFKNFVFEVAYSQVGDNKWKATERTFEYEASLGKDDFKVNTTIIDSNFDLEPKFDKQFFGSEIISYSEEALERDTAIWSALRPRSINVSPDEQEFIIERDSVWNYEHSEEYYMAQDSNYNKITLINVLWSGVNYRNRGKGISFGFVPLVGTIRPLGVGGYRQSIGGWVRKEFPSNNAIRVNYNLDYGFANNDLKGNVRVDYTYWPQKFGRFFVRGGDTYDLITIYESLDNVLSRGNYVRNTRVGFGHAHEVVNGLYATFELGFGDKRSIQGLELADWSNFLFGENNEPQPFERYKALIFEAELLYKFGQKYITRGRKKIVLGNNYPQLRLAYKKGVPVLFGSEVNYDHLELQLSQEMPLTKVGNTNWSILAGRYLNQKSLRFIEYKYFRGSTPYIFSNPMRDHQLLGPTLSTSDTYIQGMIIHHFNGFIMDKIPGINWLQLELITGGGTLAIPSQDFYHIEAFAGLGRRFKIRGETFQVAVYGTTSDNTVEKWDVSYKVGINFFNAFSGKWMY